MTGLPALKAGSWMRFSLGSHISRMSFGGRNRPVLKATSSAVQMKSTPLSTAAWQKRTQYSVLISSISSTKSRSS